MKLATAHFTMFRDFTHNKQGHFLTPEQYRTMIASQRMDDLDRACLNYIDFLKQTHNQINVIDFGGRYGVHAKRMSIAGAGVTMIDKLDLPSDYFSAYGHDGKIFSVINHVQKNFLDVNERDIPTPLHIIYSQRALNYISYKDAYDLLARLFDRLTDDGAIFLSMAGAETEYGLTHEMRESSIEHRFAKISPQMQEKHKIYDDICVYFPHELAAMAESIGFKDVQFGRSDFGNAKIIGFKSGKPPLEVSLQS